MPMPGYEGEWFVTGFKLPAVHQSRSVSTLDNQSGGGRQSSALVYSYADINTGMLLIGWSIVCNQSPVVC